jgi:hypothetical protein
VHESELPKNILCKLMHSLVTWAAIGARNPFCFQGIEGGGMAFHLHTERQGSVSTPARVSEALRWYGTRYTGAAEPLDVGRLIWKRDPKQGTFNQKFGGAVAAPALIAAIS